MNKLIYHDPKHNNIISPFDHTLIEIIKDKEIKIACPYMSVYYINKLITLCKDWRILTDLNAWIYSQTSIKQKRNIYDFLMGYQEHIHHYPELHAKVIITDSNLFLGSANFTDSGIFKKNEMSILITDDSNIHEANQWFDAWWEVTNFPSKEELEEAVESNNYSNFKEDLVKVKSKAPKINTSEVPLYSSTSNSEKSILKISEISLINYLQKWDNNQWEWDFFEMIKKAIDLSALSKKDKYLTLTLTNSGSITFQINNRYVLKSHSYGKPELIGMMLPLEFRDYINKYKDEIHEIEPFTHNKSEVALWVLFKKKKLVFDDIINNLWKEAITKEINRKYLSPYKRFHQELIFDIAMDIEKRKKLFTFNYN